MGNVEAEQSEFSDAMSDTSLLETKVGGMRHLETRSNMETIKSSQSSATSGIGSSEFLGRFLKFFSSLSLLISDLF